MFRIANEINKEEGYELRLRRIKLHLQGKLAEGMSARVVGAHYNEYQICFEYLGEFFLGGFKGTTTEVLEEVGVISFILKSLNSEVETVKSLSEVGFSKVYVEKALRMDWSRFFATPEGLEEKVKKEMGEWEG